MPVLPHLPRIAAVLALVASLSALAQSNPAEDWFAGKTGASSVTYAGAPFEVRFGHPAPPTSLLNQPWQRSFDRLGKITNGKIAVKHQGAGTLIGARDGFKGVRGGVAEWATCYVQNEGRGLPLSRVFEQPFVVPSNPMAGVRIAQELAAKYFAPEFQKQGVVWGSAIVAMPADLMSKKPVRRWEDLNGMKVIAQGFSPELAKAMGITLVNVPFPEAYVALQQGLADGMFWVDAGFVPYKIFEIAKFHTSVGIAGFSINQCYNREFFDKLPADLKEVFYNTQEPMAMVSTKISMLDFNRTALATYKERGVEMIALPAAEMQRWRDLSAPTVDKWAADLEKEGMGARALLADIKRLGEKYNRMAPDDLVKLSVESPVKGIR